MTTRRDRATAGQITLIQNMIRSHVITDREREKFNAAIANGVRFARASEAIEWLKETIPARKAIEARGEPCQFCDTGEVATQQITVEANRTPADAPESDVMVYRLACGACATEHGEG